MRMDNALYPPIDYLAIGHVCHDLVAGGRVVGGAAAYGASIAQALGCRTGIVTSASPEDEWQRVFPGITVHQTLSATTTVFENVYTPMGRAQTIHAVAERLTADDIPRQWSRSPMVHIGPIANEVDPGLVRLFSNSTVGVGPQGWMRRWDEAGRVYQVAWNSAADVLPFAAVTFVSLEDLIDPAMLDAYARLSTILVVTDAQNGCTVHFHNEERVFAAPEVNAADTTGAGDIFAAAYLVRLHQTDGNLWEAAEFANRIAACSVTRRGLPAKIEAIRRIVTEDLWFPKGEW